jgi:hypothetical protein
LTLAFVRIRERLKREGAELTHELSFQQGSLAFLAALLP